MERLLVFEFASGCSDIFKGSVLAEGFSMLKLISEGLKNYGYFVEVAVRSDIMRWKPLIDVDKIIELNFPSKDAIKELRDIAEKEGIDYIFPIAPENELGGIVRSIRSNGIDCIASEPDAIEIAADKWKTHLNLKMLEIAAPKTLRMEKDTLAGEIESNLEYPLIIKNVDGVSCEGLYKAMNGGELEDILNAIKKDKQKFIAQEFIEGVDASVSVFSDGGNSVAVSLNRQYIILSAYGSEYNGGEVPFNHPQWKKALKDAESAVNAVSGIMGAVGVDLVISDKPYIIEINPRITTSMIGLELASGMNAGEWTLRSYLGELPTIPKFSKKIIFSKTMAKRNIKYNEKHKFKNLFASPVSYSDEIKRGECLGISVEEAE